MELRIAPAYHSLRSVPAAEHPSRQRSCQLHQHPHVRQAGLPPVQITQQWLNTGGYCTELLTTDHFLEHCPLSYRWLQVFDSCFWSGCAEISDSVRLLLKCVSYVYPVLTIYGC